jgi:hypothetical protein
VISEVPKAMIMKTTFFWGVMLCSLLIFQNIMPSLSESKSTPRKQTEVTCYLLGLFFDPKTQAVIASEMSVNFYQTIQHSIPEESIPYTFITP